MLDFFCFDDTLIKNCKIENETFYQQHETCSILSIYPVSIKEANTEDDDKLF